MKYGALVEFDGIVEDIIKSPSRFSQKPGLGHKKEPQAVYALGVPGRRDVGGWGAARSAYVRGK